VGLVDWIGVIKSPEVAFGRSDGVLGLFSKFDTEKLAGHAVFGMFSGFQRILMYRPGWKHLAKLLPLASTLGDFAALYLHFLHLVWKPYPRVSVYGGTTSDSLSTRMLSHLAGKSNPKVSSFHYYVWKIPGIDGEFWVAASYGDASFALYELVKSLTIACLGLFDIPLLLRLSSRIQLHIIAAR
jgi:hypothetical protein